MIRFLSRTFVILCMVSSTALLFGAGTSGWTDLGSGLSIRYTKEDFKYDGDAYMHKFEIRNDSDAKLEVVVEVKIIDSKGKSSVDLETFTVNAKSSAGGGGNFAIARSVESFTLKSIKKK